MSVCHASPLVSRGSACFWPIVTVGRLCWPTVGVRVLYHRAALMPQTSISGNSPQVLRPARRPTRSAQSACDRHARILPLYRHPGPQLLELDRRPGALMTLASAQIATGGAMLAAEAGQHRQSHPPLLRRIEVPVVRLSGGNIIGISIAAKKCAVHSSALCRPTLARCSTTIASSRDAAQSMAAPRRGKSCKACMIRAASTPLTMTSVSAESEGSDVRRRTLRRPTQSPGGGR